MPLADPTTCRECDGSGLWNVERRLPGCPFYLGRCQRCGGSGIVCNLCDKGEHDCDCGGSPDSFEGVKREDGR
jgi:hypothetical protein